LQKNKEEIITGLEQMQAGINILLRYFKGSEDTSDPLLKARDTETTGEIFQNLRKCK